MMSFIPVAVVNRDDLVCWIGVLMMDAPALVILIASNVR